MSIVLNEWHTMMVKNVFSSNAATAVTIWLDPNFTKTETNQPNAPLVLAMNNNFNGIHLRCGNGSAWASFSNVVMAATAPGVGFANSVVPPAVLSMQNLGGGNLQISWTSTDTLQQAAAITGPWTNSVNQTTHKSSQQPTRHYFSGSANSHGAKDC
jgi:hypothetical protein